MCENTSHKVNSNCFGPVMFVCMSSLVFLGLLLSFKQVSTLFEGPFLIRRIFQYTKYLLPKILLTLMHRIIYLQDISGFDWTVLSAGIL